MALEAASLANRAYLECALLQAWRAYEADSDCPLYVQYNSKNERMVLRVRPIPMN